MRDCGISIVKFLLVVTTVLYNRIGTFVTASCVRSLPNAETFLASEIAATFYPVYRIMSNHPPKAFSVRSRPIILTQPRISRAV